MRNPLKSISSLLCICFFLSLFVFTTTAQDTGLLHQLKEEEQSAIEAIALYPAKERAAILTVSMHPEILVRMDHIRSNTETQFKALLTGIPEEDQKKIYNLARYPELISSICDAKEKRSNKDMDKILEPYAEEIHADAQFCNKKYFDLLQGINTLGNTADRAFRDVLAAYPENVQDACWQLAQLPSVVTVLNGNMNMTVLLGDIYRRQPDQLNKELDSLNIVLAEQQAKDLEVWKQELESNPEAKAEFEAAAQEFAGQQNDDYDDDVYDGPLPERYTQEVYVQNVWQPYPYWFGWPWWYTYECWYPYPWYYHWGFYYGAGNAMIFIGMPSNYFWNWHFYYDDHFYHYPHFTDQVMHHYYGPRDFGAHVQPVLRDWEAQHSGELPKDWLNEDKDRVNRIREYGRFKMEYDEVVKLNREKSPTQREYLKDNADRYPTLKPVLKEHPESPRPKPQPTKPYEPPVRTVPPDQKAPTDVIEKQNLPPQEEIDRAKENHENTWDRYKSQPRQQPQKSPPPPPPHKDNQKSSQRTPPPNKQPSQRQPH